MRPWRDTTATIPGHVIAGAAVTGILLGLLTLAPNAAAAEGWSRTPGSALPGTAVRVASSPSTLCQWLQPTPTTSTSTSSTTTTSTTTTGNTLNGLSPGPASGRSTSPTGTEPISAQAAGDPTAYDGTRVELRLVASGLVIPIGSVRVTTGGAWSGSVTLPGATELMPGEYELIPRCIVDDPALDGVRSFDFDPLPLTVTDAPPPTTIITPTEIGEPLTITKPDVEGTQLNRIPANQRAPVPTLPNTGDGTLGVALAGFGALALGGGALWWGSRRASEDADDPYPVRG